jgi:Ni/Fe-hydrogenase subunit HybB-like protein
MIPLLLENFPPFTDWLYSQKPQYRPYVKKSEEIMIRFYPFIVGLAYLLPAMHQSSLGALMLLGGDRVYPLWQTPWLPILYVWAAAFLGFSCVAGTLLFCSLVWKRPIDRDVLVEMNRITAGLIGTWLMFRFADILFRGVINLAFKFTIYAGLFWMETLLLALALWMLLDSSRLRDPRLMFHAHLMAAVGGMLYRFDPTTLAFQPKPGAFYFPTPIELFISVGFVALAIAAFMFLVKVLAILPAPMRLWYSMEARENKSQRLAAITAAD